MLLEPGALSSLHPSIDLNELTSLERKSGLWAEFRNIVTEEIRLAPKKFEIALYWHGAELAKEPSQGNEYVLVMEWAGATLNDEMRKKQIAGIDVAEVKNISRCVAESLQHMHEHPEQKRIQ